MRSEVKLPPLVNSSGGNLFNYNKAAQFILQSLTGNYRVSEFALTNTCIARCSFCSIWKQQPKVTITTDEALKVIDKLASFGVRQITLTGGEALLHRDIVEIVQRCSKHGIVSSIPCADPRLITVARASELKRAGLDYLFISIDHHTDEVEYEARDIKNLLYHIKNAVATLKEFHIRTAASILICRFNHTSLKELFDKCNELGFGMVAINYPETSLSPTYALGGEAANLSPLQIAQALEEVISLKMDGYNIINPVESMNNIVQYFRTGKAKYPCLGGNKVMFVDWFGTLYPCMHLDRPLGMVLEMRKGDLVKNASCNQCNMSWYRDFSIYLNGAKSILPIIKAFS